MDLVIAEKNELARDIAAAMCVEGKPKDVRLPARSKNMTVCAASGHLLGLAEPAEVDGTYARTEPEDLPIRIYPWPVRPQGDYQKSKLDEICKLVSECDGVIYHAGDADAEGQLIVDEILEWAGIDPADGRVMRVYVNDNIAKNIRRAFENATPNAEHVADGRAAKARSLGDFCFGVNESRLASARLHAKVSLGRVQTPTLGLVVNRDLAREGHVKREYYELRITAVDDEAGVAVDYRYKPPEEDLEDGKHCFERESLENVAAKVGGARFTAEIHREEKRAASPLPYNMTSLVSDMSKRFGMTADDVMEATQALRDKWKAITYNRAESRHLPDEHFEQAPAVTAAAARNIGWEAPIDTSKKHAAFDSSKVGNHHGIVPQEQRVDLESLPEREREVYRAIAQRYLCLFLPDARYYETTSTWKPDDVGGTFEHKARALADAGWTQWAPAQWSTLGKMADELPPEGARRYAVDDARVEAKETAPPAAFTDGTLMVAMSNIARYVADPDTKRILLEKDKDSKTEHGSIGTAATRKDIIEGLVERGFIERRNGKLVSTDKGKAFHALVPDEIKGADLTAKWHLIQERVRAGEEDEDAVMNSVCEEFLRHRDTAYAGASLRQKVGTCPLCGKGVEKRGRAYLCESIEMDDEMNDIAGCGFRIVPFCGKDITVKQAQSLLAGKQVALKGCVSRRTGNKFDCKVALGKDGKLEIVKEPAAKKPSKAKGKRGRR